MDFHGIPPKNHRLQASQACQAPHEIHAEGTAQGSTAATAGRGAATAIANLKRDATRCDRKHKYMDYIYMWIIYGLYMDYIIYIYIHM